MNIAAQYAVVNNAGRIVVSCSGSQAGLAEAWGLVDEFDDYQGVVIVGVTGIHPIGRDGWYLDDTLEPIRGGVPDPVLGDKVRHLL